MAARNLSDATVLTLGDPGNLASAPGSRSWAIAVRLELQSAIHKTKGDATHMARMSRLMQDHAGYRELFNAAGQPFSTYRAFCEEPPPRGLGYDPDTLQRIIDERLTAQARAQQPPTLFDQGRPALEDQANKPVNHRFNDQYGSGNAEYDTARIARDHPDILDRMKAGEFPSVHAAAKEAGIAKRRVSVPCDPIGAARIIKRHFDGDQIGALIDALTDADHT